VTSAAEYALQEQAPFRPLRADAVADVAAEGISVVVPCFNAAGSLDRTLSSLQAQSYGNWEAIVVDDGSHDGGAELAESWAARDRRITVVRQHHAGAAAARNRGLASASRPWLCFLDADDWLSPRAFEQWLAAAASAPEAAVLVGRCVRVSQAGRTWPWPKRDLTDAFGVLCSECAIPIHSALVRRSAVLAVGGFDETLKTNEDWDLWQRIARAGLIFRQTDDLVAYYRTRLGSLSRNLEQATTDALEVMRRGHGPDPRLPDVQGVYARGAPPDALAARQLYYVLWSAARDIAAGGDGLSIADLLPAKMDEDFEPDSIGELMAFGVADMLALRPGEAGRAWPQMEPKFRRLLERIYPEPARGRLVALAMASTKAVLNGGCADDSDALRLGSADLPRALDGGGDFVALQLQAGTRTLGTIALPMLAARSGADVAEAVAGQIGALPLVRALLAARPWRSVTFWIAAARTLLDLRGLGLWSGRREPRRLARILRHRLRHALRCGLEAGVAAGLGRAGRDKAPSPHTAELARLREEAMALPAPLPLITPPTDRAPGVQWPGEQAAASAWDSFFAAEDPWNRASDYERLKFDDTLEMVPDLPAGSALELACAEGHFTQRLAGKVGSLLATDISATALMRAQARCQGLANVTFQPLDFIRQPMPGRFDLIVCSEALYYAGRQLRPVARKIAESLKPGGWLVMANSAMIADEPEATGFDWGHEHGARTIGEVFESMDGMRLELEIRRPLYRVQAFRRSDSDAAAGPRFETRPLQVPLECTVARNVVWGGGTSRLACFRRELAVTVPILMYHRIASRPAHGLERYCVDPETFEQQIAYLRRSGYWGVTPENLLHALSRNIPLPGRPVMLTFDDGYADFAEHAWPTLLRHDFSATVFVVADAVGGRANWDAAYGRPAELMDWSTLAELAAAGVRIENHGAAHRPYSRLSVRECYRDVLRGAALIAKATGRSPLSFCYPYGAHDRVAECIVREAGVQLAFTTAAGVASLANHPLRLPRVEVSGFDDLQSFARKLGR
jgi:peptidoglycan/xylan/chitin deacetylase (PgdA/CDA1 family)/SAM-dependent methyltransferase